MIVIGALTSHAAAMAAVHAASFSESERWSESAIVSLLAQPGVSALADTDGGFLLLRVAADEAEILTLAVAPMLRRRGRARDLLQAAEDVARQAGAATMFLEVMDCNGAALALYRSAGYRATGRRPRYYPGGEDAVVMRRDLSSAATARG